MRVEQGHGARSHGSYRDAPVEERVAVLETRWEATVPTLATSKDISELRGEMRSLENRLLRWGVGALLALLAVFAAVFIANTARMDALDAKLDSRFDTLTARQDKLDAKIDSRFDALTTRQDALDAKLDARFDALMAELRASRERRAPRKMNEAATPA